jgi:hypothetical protein
MKPNVFKFLAANKNPGKFSGKVYGNVNELRHIKFEMRMPDINYEVKCTVQHNWVGEVYANVTNKTIHGFDVTLIGPEMRWEADNRFFEYFKIVSFKSQKECVDYINSNKQEIIRRLLSKEIKDFAIAKTDKFCGGREKDELYGIETKRIYTLGEVMADKFYEDCLLFGLAGIK